MLSKLTVANAAGTDVVLHEDAAGSKRQLITAKGLVGVGPLRSSKRVRPQAHGSINETTFEEGRTIELTGEVMSQAGIEAALEEFRKVSGVLLETLDSGPALMKWTEGVSGLKLQQLVKLDSECEPTLNEAAGFVQYPVSLFAEDPRAYTQTLTTTTGTGITGTAYEATFVKTLQKAVAVCVDASHIYWVDGVTKAVGRCALAGGTIENEWIKTTLSLAPTCLAIDASHVYWGVPPFPFGANSHVGRATIAGATIEQEWLATSSVTPQALAVNASNIFIGSGPADTRVSRATIAGGSFEKDWLVLGTGHDVKALAVDGTFLYYGLPGEIGRVKLTGAENERTWIAGTGSVTGLAVNASFVYWTSSTGRAIGRAKINGLEPNPAFVSGLEAEPAALAVNTEHLYWGESTKQIARSKELAGGGPTGSEVKVKNLGNRPTPVSFKIVGPALNPSVVCPATGARIALTGEVTSGNFVEIDTFARTVKLNGTSSLLGFLQAQATNWAGFSAPASPAEEAYVLTASSATAATLAAIYRSAYA